MTEEWKESSLSRPIIKLSIIFLWLVFKLFCNSHFFPRGNLYSVNSLVLRVFCRHCSHTEAFSDSLLPWWKGWNSLRDTLLPENPFLGMGRDGSKTSKVVDRYPQAWHWGKFSIVPQTGTQSSCLLDPGTVSTLSWLGHHLLIPVLHTEPLLREVERELEHWPELVEPSQGYCCLISEELQKLLGILLAMSREGGNVFVEDSLEWSRIYSFTWVRVPEGTYICNSFWELLSLASSRHLLLEIP